MGLRRNFSSSNRGCGLLFFVVRTAAAACSPVVPDRGCGQLLVVLTVGLQVLDTLRRREDEHHRDDGHCTESLERERHSKFILN
jgi:hypothetical protein